MKRVLDCRRTFVSLVGVTCLTGLGAYQGVDVSIAITGIVAALCGANAFQGVGEKKAVASIQYRQG